MHRYIISTALTVLVVGAAGALDAGAAHAQCSIGDYIGTCTSEIGYAGCCPTSASIQWCEGALLCGIDCSGNTGHEGCCEASEFGGCESAVVEDCVCTVDDFCCDIFGAWDEFCVQIATEQCGACAAGGAPAQYCGWLGDEGFYDCREVPSADPTGVSPTACGASCTATCGGKQCGSDGCGGSCGACTGGATCNALGQCIAACVPQCSGKDCGSDGCGGSCGQCASMQTCVSNQCQDNQCVPQCIGRSCGDNGCGGNCGICPGSDTCSATGQCQPAACVPQCGGKTCGDDGCGGSCGACAIGSSCQVGACVASCVPSCANSVCGDDGCGGSCGTCAQNERCEDGACLTSCSCAGKACGDDGCGRVCGYCIAGETCSAEAQCVPAVVTPEPSADASGEVIGSQNCPRGQVWSAYANACVVDANNVAVPGQSDSGCAGGGGSGWLALLGLLPFGLRRARVATLLTGR